MADAPDTERQAVNPDSRAVLSVSQLNDRIASVVEETPALHGVRCIGEVTDLHQNSTALYFTLTDGNAELPCMLWANRYRNMDVDLETGPRSSSKATSTTGSKAGKSTSNRGKSSSSATATRRRPSSDCEANSRSVAGSTTSRNSGRRRSRSGSVSSLPYVAMPGTTSRTRSTNRTRPLTS